MSRTVSELLTVLGNLAESWQTMGHASQAKVQREALSELKALLAEKQSSTTEPEPTGKQRQRR